MSAPKLVGLWPRHKSAELKTLPELPEADQLNQAAARIIALRRTASANRAVLVGVSGIDASGKGYVTAHLASRVEQQDLRVANINVDGWLNLPHLRFSTREPGRHFYEHALRLAEMFDQLILPLRARRSLVLEMDYADETATQYRRHRYEFHDVDVILLEGIFLLKRKFRQHFDLTCWVDCSFATAVQRAIRRGQEGLTPEETMRAFEMIYLPAQRLHFERDQPREAADLPIANDPHLTGRTF